ncbi:MAG: hypothetical protein HQ522_18145 [Bacteroidetes bacterium]|nr:hypothetical protein [Bacteroidota bacterium]
MIKLADIYKYKNGRKKIVFFELGIYDLLKEKLGYRYTKINGKGYYLKDNNGIYEVSYFHHLGNSFRTYIEQEFENLEISNQIDLHSFMNEYYHRKPIKDGNYARDYLSEGFQLSNYNLQLILQNIDPRLKFENDKKEMLVFLKNENFTETIDTIGNLRKEYPLFYKQLSENKFLIFNQPYYDLNSKQTIYDFWKIEAKNEKEFLLKKTKNFVSIKYGFNMLDDIDRYNNENKKNVW